MQATEAKDSEGKAKDNNNHTGRNILGGNNHTGSKRLNGHSKTSKLGTMFPEKQKTQ